MAKKHYVNNKKLLEHLIKRRELVQQWKDGEIKVKPRIDNYIGECIYLLATRIATRGNFSGYCVDKETEALTQRGWLGVNEINESDKILSVGPDGHHIWSDIKSIYRGQYDGLMHKLNSKKIDALVTPEHKFLTDRMELLPVELIRNHDRLITLGQPLINNNVKYTDDFVKLVGWSFCEGCYSFGKFKHAVEIYQNPGYKSDLIEDILLKLNVKYKKYSKQNYCDIYHITGDVANKIIECAPHNDSKNKYLSLDFIFNLTIDQRKILIDTCILADGHVTKLGARSFVQKDKQAVDHFLILCTLAGIKAVSHLMDSKKINKSFKERGYNHIAQYYNINLYNDSNSGRSVKGSSINFNGGRGQYGANNGFKITRPNKPTTYYNDIVWCPETEYGNWVCRRNNKIYVTGNTYREEMIGDGIENCVNYLDNFNPEKSNNPFGYFSLIITRAFIRRIDKEKKSQYAMYKYYQTHYDTEQLESGSDRVSAPEYIDVFVEQYEKKLQDKANKL